VTGQWVTGIEAVLAPGQVVTVGGAFRKDVAGYDLKNLLVGSEGTLGIITSIWLRLIPAPEATAPVLAFYDGIASGCAAIERVLGSGIPVAALEYLDPASVAAAPVTFAVAAPKRAFVVVAEVDGSPEEVERLRADVLEALGGDALAIYTPESAAEIADLWRWRDGVSIAVSSVRGGKVSEDIVVPLDRLAEAIEGTLEIGRRHGLDACSWGHAGDGNLHSTFMVNREEPAEIESANDAAHELFELAARLRGSVSGEHGVGFVKNGELSRVWSPRAVALHGAIKQAFDPKGLLNPGKKLA
jgi:FAD/FMN-containing dehydrogenase